MCGVRRESERSGDSRPLFIAEFCRQRRHERHAALACRTEPPAATVPCGTKRICQRCRRQGHNYPAFLISLSCRCVHPMQMRMHSLARLRDVTLQIGRRIPKTGGFTPKTPEKSLDRGIARRGGNRNTRPNRRIPATPGDGCRPPTTLKNPSIEGYRNSHHQSKMPTSIDTNQRLQSIPTIPETMKTPSTQRQITRLAIVAIAAFGAASSAHAADVTWTSAGANDNWSTPANWSNPASPASTEDIVFNNTGGAAGTTVTNIVDTATGINSLNFRQDNTVNQTLSISSGQTCPSPGHSRRPQARPRRCSSGSQAMPARRPAPRISPGWEPSRSTAPPTISWSATRMPREPHGYGQHVRLEQFQRDRGHLRRRAQGHDKREYLPPAGRRFDPCKKQHDHGQRDQRRQHDPHQRTQRARTTKAATSTLNLGSGGSAVNNLYADKMSFGIGKAIGNMNFATGVAATDTVKIRAKNTTGAVGTFEIGVRNMSSCSGTPKWHGELRRWARSMR